MKAFSLLFMGFLTFFVISASNPKLDKAPSFNDSIDQLRPESSSEARNTAGLFPTNEEEKNKSLLAFDVILKVLKDPRCINCHPTDDRPRQGDDQHLHLFNVRRGKTNQGGPIQFCSGCHGDDNNVYSGVPGAPHWGLAPKSMGWLGLSDYEIGQKFISKSSNGQRSPEALAKHMTEDALVLWGWNPGENRKPVQVPFEEFKKAVADWLDNGAHVPSK